MRRATVEILRAIDRRFYEEHGDAFARTRRAPWRGFARFLQTSGEAPRVLDVGCGNARLARVLFARCPQAKYVGIDASRRLIDHARRDLRDAPWANRVRLVVADVLEPGWAESLGEGSFDLVVVVGLLHHIPGFRQRRTLVASLLRKVDPGGRLVIALWQLEPGRRIPWADYNHTTPAPVELDDLETGDHLLAFGEAGAVRYAHRTDVTEAERLVDGLVVIDRYWADGPKGCSNLYLVLTTGARHG